MVAKFKIWFQQICNYRLFLLIVDYMDNFNIIYILIKMLKVFLYPIKILRYFHIKSLFPPKFKTFEKM